MHKYSKKFLQALSLIYRTLIYIHDQQGFIPYERLDRLKEKIGSTCGITNPWNRT